MDRVHVDGLIAEGEGHNVAQSLYHQTKGVIMNKHYDIEYRRADLGDVHYWHLFMTDVEGYRNAERIADNLADDFGMYVVETRVVEV